MGKISSTSNGLVSTFIAPFGEKKEKKRKMYLNKLYSSFFFCIRIKQASFLCIKMGNILQFEGHFLENISIVVNSLLLSLLLFLLLLLSDKRSFDKRIPKL